MVCVLKWWFIFICSIAILGAMFALGVLQRLWIDDTYKAVFVTIMAYICCTVFVGRITFSLKSRGVVDYLRYQRSVDFMPDMMTQIGLIGTAIGFILMMGGFVVTADAATMQQASAVMIDKAVIALYNTVAGLVCSLLMKFQVLNLMMAAE